MVRILVCGDPGSNFVKISQKLDILNKKSGPFKFALLLTQPGHLPETFSSPLPTYFASQDYEDSPIPRQVRLNLFYLGPTSNLRLHDLNLVFISGGYDDPTSSALPSEVETALHRAGVSGAGFRGADVLVTPDIPHGVEIDHATSLPSRLVGEVALRLRPRYHFVSAHQFVALPPFSCPNADHGTRLLAVAGTDAPKNNGKTSKWVYAADILPLDLMNATQRAETTPKIALRAPYVGVVPKITNEKLHAAAARITQEVMSGGESDQYFWSVRGRGRKRENGNRFSERRKKARRASVETPVDAACWFCLSNEKDAHLVVDIGHHMYLALAKGGINDDHLLIVPIDHVRSSVDRRLRKGMGKELEMYKRCIAMYYEATLRGAKAYFFERAVTTRGGAKQMHMHVNAIPVQKELCGRVLENAEAAAARFSIVLKKLNEKKHVPVNVTTGNAQEAGVAHADSENIANSVERADEPEGNLHRGPEKSVAIEEGAAKLADKDIPENEKQIVATTEAEEPDTHVTRVLREVDESDEFFYAELPCGARLLHVQNVSEDGKGKHPLHFGRAVAAATLGRPDLVDWKVCVQDEKVEIEKAEQLRDRIQEFLPAIEPS